jgi:hypothetical protein
MFKTMMITSLEMLSEHDLIAPPTPVPNASVLTLLMIYFLSNVATDFSIKGVGAIVKMADKVGLEIEVREEVEVTKDDLEKLRKAGGKMGDWKKEVSFLFLFFVLKGLEVWHGVVG